LKKTIIKSELISRYPDLAHGISTKLGGYEYPPFYNNMSYKVGDSKDIVEANRFKFFSSLGIDQSFLAVPQQVHSDNVMIIDKPGYYENTDALITAKKNLFLIISTADCYSILIYDNEREAASAVHSGWRGTQKKILTKTINIMLSDIGCMKENLNIFIGPGICKEHFEVGKDVAGLFESRFIENSGGTYFVDLKAHILDQLREIGIAPGQIEAPPFCTYEQKEYLHSYRRERNRSGRMFSVIGMRQKYPLILHC
jgi:YfiH family protein